MQFGILRNFGPNDIPSNAFYPTNDNSIANLYLAVTKVFWWLD
jgi:hypothetical protein